MFRKIKFFFQRIKRGFDDSETWSLDYQFYRWLLPRLKRFRQLTKTYPCNMTYEKWLKDIDVAIADLEILTDDTVFGDEYDEAYKRFIKWFSKNLNHLWW